MTVKVNLSTAPDAYGFHYGQALTADGELIAHVNVLPPTSQWAGDMELDGYEPDADSWILYADGEEIGRVRSLEDASRVLSDQLTLRDDRDTR